MKNNRMNFIVAKTKEQIAFCKDILFAFRTNLNDTTYMDLLMKMIEDERFKLVYIPADDNMRAVAFIGYRVMHTLRTSWMIYVDDLYTDPEHRGRGYAGALLDYVDQQATEAGIQSVHLDSGYELSDAHRLYFNKGYALTCNHFGKRIDLSI
ncbi:GNAT family N-acetyltransferase [Sphingobacterium sp. SRCM116780]|uniref:GNAT family N-acetyltransferase n=1 Tax=Sphingobacterium sp. SRCM116780 TaxID=2907623 RepID=UPI001F24D847|nr:GNAT family N-acetyltransferase [Sphingobacterium sp. SRCM116780]UIR54917.1 GNAT family N-acetyltransferase [Sphingobacterium sp. SRCM116780]